MKEGAKKSISLILVLTLLVQLLQRRQLLLDLVH